MTGEKVKGKSGVRKGLEYLSVCLILLSILVDYYILFQHTYTHNYEVRLEETGQQIAGSVRQNMGNAVAFVKAAATVFREFEDIHCEEAVEQMELMAEESNFTRMWLTKADGQAVSSEGNTSDATGRAYLADGIAGNSGISEVQYSRVNGEKNVVVYAPIRHGDMVTGLAIGIYKLEDMLEVIDIKCFGQNGYCRLVKKDGEVIVEGKAEAQESDMGEASYDYLCPVGVNDWYVYIRLPRNIMTEDLKVQGFLYILIGIKLMLVLLYFILDKYRTRKAVLERMARTDSLTELWNRKTIEEKINRYLHDSREKQHILIVLDVDRFKKVNDTIGHLAGDTLIKRMADALEDIFGGIGLVSRLGGDELAVFVPEMCEKNTLEEVKTRMEKLFERIQEIPSEERWEHPISVSAGTAVASQEGDSFEALYRTADNKMYEAKAVKGNSVLY